ncbi:MAG: hypothetical protein EAZ87_09405 [Nostocales cyanobacterium]|nr:MAG: hypothetical protein EAZ87_09405 [Nostocales cyanobacterium]
MIRLNFKKIKPQICFCFDQPAILSLIILPIIHFILVNISTNIAFDNGVSAFWPSAGVYVAGILRLGWRFLPAIIFSELLVNSWLYTSVYKSNYAFLIIILVTCISTFDSLIIYSLKNRFIGKKYFYDNSTDIFKFLLIVAGESFFTSHIAITFFALTNNVPWSDYQISWLSWWLPLPLDILLITPPILVWTQNPKKQKPLPSSWRIELFFMLFLIVLISQISFSGSYAIEYTLLPVLIWSAFRLRLKETSLLTLLITVIAIVGTTQGSGSFSRKETLESLILLQSFIGVFALTTLVLSATIKENWWAEIQLKQANENLEERVKKRTLELQETLAELQLTQTQIIQSEKMSSLGQLVAGVAHEINNPVNFIYGNITYLKEYIENLLNLISLYQQNQKCDNYDNSHNQEIQNMTATIDLNFVMDDLPKIINSMEVGTERIRDIVRALRNFSRMDEAEVKKVNIHDGIESTLLILQHRLKANADEPEIKVIRDYGDLPLVECYAGQLNQVFMNIIVNAIDAIEESHIQLSKVERKENLYIIKIITSLIENNWIEIILSDNGKGMPEHIKNHIFDPFFTTKEIGKGTGMGMAISYQIITEKHGGKLEFNSQLGQGTEFKITIPVKQ